MYYYCYILLIVALPLNASKANEISNTRYGTMLNRGGQYAPYMMDFARFYGIPVLSVTDVLYPSFVRFFLTHNENERWPYTADGSHTSPEGCAIVAEYILKPFFLDQMTPRESDLLYEKPPPFGPYPLDFRMFHSDQYKEIHIVGMSYFISITIIV